MVKRCPRRGYLGLTCNNGDELIIERRCKTWDCKSCKWQNYQRIVDMITYGCLTQGPYYVITVTLKADRQRNLDAKYVGGLFSRLLREVWKDSREQTMRWFKVVELTKKGTPHFHLIVGGIGTMRDNCLRPEAGNDRSKNLPFNRRWLARQCDCLAHVWSKRWDRITGHESFIVDAERVYSSAGIGSYLCKYLVKGFADREGLLALGFSRRWACSRNWIREYDVQTRGAIEGYSHVRTIERSSVKMNDVMRRWVEEDREDERLIIEGVDAGDWIRQTRRERSKLKQLKKAEERLHVSHI